MTDEHDSESAHEHVHADGTVHAPHPTREDDDLELTESEAKYLAVKALLIERNIITADEIRVRMEQNERHKPEQAAKMVARAWIDPEYKARMLADSPAAGRELGIEIAEHVVTMENTPGVHNVIVCTLCSCYPRSLLGEPPAFYVSKAYRSRTVREPRKVLREFGLDLPEDVEIKVHDSNADLRYIVMPMRPAGTEGLDEEALAKIVTRDCLVGCALPQAPAAG